MSEKVSKKPIIDRKAHQIDATEQPLGRLATRIATILRGKHKVTYQPHVDAGDFVVVAHPAQVVLTGLKRQQKVYHHYSGYPGGLKTRGIAEQLRLKPSEVLRKAVYNMLPPTRLRAAMMKRLTFKD